MVLAATNVTSSPAPPPQFQPPPPSPPSPDNATSPATIAYESVISLRQLNIAVVAVLILLVILVLVLSFVKARATWQHQRAATQDPDPQALQPVGNRGLLMDGRNMRSGVPDHIIKTLGKSFTYVEPGDDLEAGGTSALGGDGGGGAEERGVGGGGVGEGGALGASGRSSSRRSAAAEATGGESEGNGAGGRAGREEGDDEKECIVCLGEYKTGDVIRQLHACNHQFHQDCIDAWLKTNSSCPLCRTSLIPSRLLGNNQSNLSDIPEQQGMHGSVVRNGQGGVLSEPVGMTPFGSAMPLLPREGPSRLAYITIPSPPSAAVQLTQVGEAAPVAPASYQVRVAGSMLPTS
ncbi:unnamed protein product [Closterium sp. NIES-65]|nr:unnamed protein product [Closterium sp. NIES-65]